MDYKMALLTFFNAFILSFIIADPMIKYLRRLKMGQTERKEGVASHLLKAGTPTMGGFIIIIGFIVASTIMTIANRYYNLIPILIFILAFGLIGFVDDYLKVVKKSSDGFKAKQKFVCELFVTLLLFLYLCYYDKDLLYFTRLPFVHNSVYIGLFSIILMFFTVLGTVNAVNFTDGIDGLATSVTFVVNGFYAFYSYFTGNFSLFYITMAMAAVLIVFAIFNFYPAKVFMGDTGSLFLGGYVSIMAYMLGVPVFILIIGIIYFIEILSVIMQVTYFKKTGGKRIFKMTPIHHHFELSGWSEKKIVLVFTSVTIITSIIAISILQIYR